MGLVKDITDVLSNFLNIDMKSIQFSSDDGIFTGNISVVVANKAQLDAVMLKIKNVQGVTKINRKQD